VNDNDKKKNGHSLRWGGLKKCVPLLSTPAGVISKAMKIVRELQLEGVRSRVWKTFTLGMLNENCHYPTLGGRAVALLFEALCYRMFIVQASQCVVPLCGIFLAKWRSSFTGNSYGKMNVQSASF
jgi:hypothetical protein